MRPHSYLLIKPIVILTLLCAALTLWPAASVQAGGSGNWRTLDTRNSQILSDNVQVIAEAAPDRWEIPGLWFGTDRGLSYFNGREWANFTAADSDLPHTDIRDILVTDDGVWFATGGGAARFDGEAWEILITANSELTSNDMTALVVDQDGTLWMATADAGISRRDATDAWLEPVRWGSGLATNTVHDLALAPDGHIWAATAQGLSRWDGLRWWRFFTIQDPLPDDGIYTVLSTADGTIWSGTNAGTIGLDQTWMTFEPATSIPSVETLGANIIDALWGNGETLWAGTRGGGVSRSFSNYKFKMK